MNYFEQLRKNTGTRFWINNPNKTELDLALKHYTFACTTNPAYCSKLLQNEQDYINGVIDAVVKRGGCDDDAQAAEVYSQVVLRLLEEFKPLYESSNGTAGFVTMQSDPRRDEDTAYMIDMCLQGKKLGDNYMAKIPVIRGGIEAIEACIKNNINICATEVFSIAQAVLICERYAAACKKYGNTPFLYVTHITGIFYEYLNKQKKNRNIDINDSVLSKAGMAVARKQYKILKNMGFNVMLLGGGARSTYHFTGLVGGDAHITINWSTADEIMEAGMKIVDCIDEQIDADIVNELRTKFPEFGQAYDDNGLSENEFANFGPVQLFRNAFLKGWYDLLAAIALRRHENAVF